MLRRGVVLAAVVASVFAQAQDIHFSQVATNNLLSNPAGAGLYDGYERIAAHHKNQWINAGTRFFSTSVSADLNVMKPKRGDRAHAGIGLQFYNDVGGDSKFGQKLFMLNVSGIVPVAEKHEIAAGLQVGLGQRSGDLTGIIFPNQFNGNELDPTMNAMEINNLVSFMYPDLGVGIVYKFGQHEIGFHRDHNTDFQIGVSYTHLTSPQLKYRLGYTEKLFSKLTIQANLVKDFDGTHVGIQAFGYQFMQGPHIETLLGALLRYRLSSGSKTTGFSSDAYLKAGLAMRINDALIPMMYIQFGDFDFGVSYDVTISKLGATARTGGLEFSLIYTNRDFALFKGRGRF